MVKINFNHIFCKWLVTKIKIKIVGCEPTEIVSEIFISHSYSSS